MLRFISTSIAVCILLCAGSPKIWSQSFEFGGGLGGSMYDGELSSDFLFGRFQLIDPAFNIYARYNFHPNMTVRLGFLQTSVRGDDKVNLREDRRRRNLDFRSNITEFSLIGEVNLPGFYPDLSRGWFVVYGFGGIAGFFFNPTTIFNGRVVELQPLGTEGQGLSAYPDRKPYSRFSISLPAGGGVKMALTQNITMSVEIGFRKTFTDYIDDVSTTYAPFNLLLRENGDLAAYLTNRTWEYLGTTPGNYAPNSRRGSPTSKDWYISGFLGISYHFYTTDVASAFDTSCPKF